MKAALIVLAVLASIVALAVPLVAVMAYDFARPPDRVIWLGWLGFIEASCVAVAAWVAWSEERDK